MNTQALIERLVGDYEFCQENPEEFMVGTGARARVSTTSMLRTVAALNIEASRAVFVQAMGLCGVHPATAAKQFAESRKITLQDSPELRQLPDGSLEEV